MSTESEAQPAAPGSGSLTWSSTGRMPPTPERVAEIRERAEKASPGPWRSYIAGSEGAHIWPDTGDKHNDVRRLGTMNGRDLAQDGLNAAFTAHARTDIPELLEWVDSLARQLAAMTAGRDACEVQLHEAFDAGSREIDLLGERLRGRIADLESTIARVEEAAHEARRGAIRLRDERDNARAAMARVERLCIYWESWRPSSFDEAAGELRAALAVTAPPKTPRNYVVGELDDTGDDGEACGSWCQERATEHGAVKGDPAGWPCPDVLSVASMLGLEEDTNG